MEYSWPGAETPLKKSLIAYLQEADSMQQTGEKPGKGLEQGKEKKERLHCSSIYLN